MKRCLGILMLCLWGTVLSREAGAVLQSGSNDSAQSESVPSATSGNKPTVKLKFRAKPKATQAVSQAASQSVAVESEPYEEEPGSKPALAANEYDPYQMGYTKQVHPANARPEGTSPVVQVVGSPNTLNYGQPRPASVLYPGHPTGSTGRARAASRSSSQQSNSSY